MSNPSKESWSFGYFGGILVAGLCGAVVGGALSTIALVGYVVAGSDRFIARFGPIGPLFGAYFTGCIGAGLIVGVLLPLARRFVGAVFVGMVGILPLAFRAGEYLFGPPATWGTRRLAVMIAWAVVMGGIGGAVFWKRLRHEFGC